MKYSFTYYLTLLIIKLKGIKKDFSKDPIDFKKIRKEDVHQPGSKYFRECNVKSFRVLNSLITEISKENTSNKLLIYIHGGAFISGPAKHHWDTLQEISQQTDLNIWMCDYPKAPENKIGEISDNIDAIYKMALEQYDAKDISFLGDSVGGTLITALTQRLIISNIELPSKIILVSPVMDASISNPNIDEIDLIDPMLSKVGIRSAKKMCAENHNLADARITPNNGSYDRFPKTILFLAEHDITYPDQLLAVDKLKESETNMEVIIGKGMPHVWPILPVMKESKMALSKIIDLLK